MDEIDSKLEVASYYQGVHQSLLQTDYLSTSNIPPLPDPDRMLETGTDNRLLEDGFKRLLEG